MHKLHFLYEYFDGPIQGISDTDIGPCFFALQFSTEQDCFLNVANLYPVDESIIDLSLFSGIPDYPLPNELDILVDKLVSDIKNGKLSFKQARARFKRIAKGASSKSFTVDWEWL